MKKPTIAVDIDDVLADSARGLIEFSNRQFGTSLKVSDYDEHLMKMWGVDLAEQERRLNMFFKKESFSKYNHNPDALSVLKKLKRKYRLIILTSRRIRAREVTFSWLTERFPGIFKYEDVYYTGIHDSPDPKSGFASKGLQLNDLGVDYLIDDQLKHCTSAAEVGIEALLFGNYKWNHASSLTENIHRVANWAEVEKYFDERA